MTQTITTEAAKALDLSIAKWKKNLDADYPYEIKTSPWDCPLCDLYLDYGACIGCPIFGRTGKTGCKDTPYYAVLEARGDSLADWTDARKTFCMEKVQEEVDWLVNLRKTCVVIA
jgi:hypothetical protein